MNDPNTTSSSLPPSQTVTSYPFYQAAPPLANSRYNRQLLIPQISLQGQQRISTIKIIIIGLGGLGSPASLYLAGAGVHTLGLLDHDVVEESNLHRQIVHRETSLHQTSPPHPPKTETGVAMTKVQSALRGCRDLNSSINYVAHEVQITGANALDIIKDYDMILDCTDNPATRYLINDCCVVLDKTLVSGAAQKLEGQIVVLNWPIYNQHGGKTESGRGPCYRCVFPHPPSPDLVKSCSEIGILGPVVGAIGTLMASEALRLVVRDGKEDRMPTMLLYNAWPSDPRSMFRVIGLRGRRKDCVVCGEDEVLTEKGLKRITTQSIVAGSMDYASWCGVANDVNLLREDERIDAHEFFDQIISSSKAIIVDVREQLEVELGPKIDGSVKIPISNLLRGSGSGANGTKTADVLDTLIHDAEDRPVYFICQRGNDSQIAAKKLMDHISRQTNGDNTITPRKSRIIGDVKGGFAALDKIALQG